LTLQIWMECIHNGTIAKKRNPDSAGFLR
jgi:hypothetical protein